MLAAASSECASARLVPPLRWRPLGVHRDGSYEGVLRRAPLPRPPAGCDRDGRGPREVRLCALDASSRAACVAAVLAVAGCGGDAADPREPPRRADARRRRGARGRRRRPSRAARRRATARAPRSTRSRSTPATARSWSARGPALFRVRRGREGGRAHPRRGSSADGQGTVSGNLVVRFAGPGDLLASGHPQAGRPAREPAADPLERPRRDLAVGRRHRRGRLPRARGRRRPDHRRQRRVAGHPGQPRRRHDRGRRARRRRADRRRRSTRTTRDHWAVSTEQGTFISTNGGGSWRPRDTDVRRPPDLAEADALYSVDRNGKVRVSADGGRSWEDRGEVGGLPSEVAAGRQNELLVAIIGGKVRRSRDGGKTWSTVDHFVVTDRRMVGAVRRIKPRRFAGVSRKSRLTSDSKDQLTFRLGLSSGLVASGPQEEELHEGNLSARAYVRRCRGDRGLALTGTAFAQDHVPGEDRRRRPDGSGRASRSSPTRGFISNGGGLGPPRRRMTVAPAANGSSCATSTSTECRWNRLDALFGYFAANGLDSVELFGHAGLPTNDDIEGPYGWKQYRALLDKHNLHAAGWHGSLNEADWPARVAAAKILGLDYIGTGNGQADGTSLNSYDEHAAQRRDPQPPRQVLGRERRRPGLRAQPHGRVRQQVRRQRRPEDRVGDPDRAHRRRATWPARSTPSGPRTRSTTRPAPRSRRSSTSTRRASS